MPTGERSSPNRNARAEDRFCGHRSSPTTGTCGSVSTSCPSSIHAHCRNLISDGDKDRAKNDRIDLHFCKAG